MHYNYCPICGLKLVPHEAGDEGFVPYCESCKKFYFDSTSNASLILIYNEYDEIVLEKSGYISDKYWTLVSGFIKVGETAEDAARREAKEEIGLELKDLTYTGTFYHPKGDVLMHGFIAFTKKKDLVKSSEIDDAKWVKKDEVKNILIPDDPGNYGYKIYRMFINGKR